MMNASLKARQDVQRAAKAVCEGKVGAKTKLAKAKKKALDVAKASIEKAAKVACSVSGIKRKKKAAPKRKTTTKKTTATRRKRTAKK